MLWKFRYRDKFTAREAVCEAPSYDVMVAAAKAWCAETGKFYISESVGRFVQFSVLEDGTRVEHDVAGTVVEKPAEPAPAVKAKKSA